MVDQIIDYFRNSTDLYADVYNGNNTDFLNCLSSNYTNCHEASNEKEEMAKKIKFYILLGIILILGSEIIIAYYCFKGEVKANLKADPEYYSKEKVRARKMKGANGRAISGGGYDGTDHPYGYDTHYGCDHGGYSGGGDCGGGGGD